MIRWAWEQITKVVSFRQACVRRADFNRRGQLRQQELPSTREAEQFLGAHHGIFGP